MTNMNTEIKAKTDLYQMITDKLVKELSYASVGAAQIPWQKPWVKIAGTGRAISRKSGNPYGVLNQMLLSRPSEYASFEQWTEDFGGKIAKGSKGETVVFFKKIEPEETEATDQKEQARWELRYYKVFPHEFVTNVERLASLEEQQESNPIQEAEALVEAYIAREGINIVTSEDVDKALYDREADVIRMPMLVKYDGDVAKYYGDLFKAIIASTGSEKRLNRTEVTAIEEAAKAEKRRNREDLLCEIGAAILLNGLGIKSVMKMDEVLQYCESWAEKLKADKYLIFDATHTAEKACKLVLEANVLANAS